MGISIATGASPAYYTEQVGESRESYYLDATTEGEPPGRWWGQGAAEFGLEGEVDSEVMHALYGKLLDPRDPRFHDLSTRAEADRLGRAPGRYRGQDEILLARVQERTGWTDEQVSALRTELNMQADRRTGGPSLDDLLAEQISVRSGLLAEDLSAMRRDAAGQARQAVSFVDATFSVPKSVTVLHTSYARAELDAQRAGDEQAAGQWAEKRRAVEDAIWAGNTAALEHLNEKAGYVRIGRHGAGADKWADARSWTVASFFQHDSRDGDPQLHIHNPILNRVVCPDGEVRTLDAQLIYKNKQGAGSIGERVMEEQLTRTLGLQWRVRADGTGREVRGVDQAAMDLFSARSRKVSAKLEERLSAFRSHFEREPSALEMDRLKRQAVMFTRRAKAGGQTTEQQLDAWDARLRTEVAGGLNRIAQTVGSARPDKVAEQAWSPSGVIAEALAACQQARAAFSRSEFERQLTLALPAQMGTLSGESVRAVVNSLADIAISDGRQVVQVTGAQPSVSLPDELRLDNGSSVYAKPAGVRYATVQHVVAEQALRRAAVVRGRMATGPGEAERWLKHTPEGRSLGVDQAAAVRGLMESGAAVSVLVGPAGTGKSHAMGAMSRGWNQLTGGRVIGLATSQIATEVLTEDGVEAMNTARWLTAQDRIAGGSMTREDRAWSLTPSDVVVVDEASMVDTAVLEQIRERVDGAGARLVLAGDPRQLASVGAGGAMAMLADGVAETYTLAEVRRFTADWEKHASLRLRAGEQAVVDEYDRRGRLFDAGTMAQAGTSAARAYLGDTLSGRASIVVVPTNEQAATLSVEIRDRLVSLGRVGAGEAVLGRCGSEVGVGDLVQARANDWQAGFVNRRRYVVDAVGEDGSLTVRPEQGGDQLTMTAAYVRESVTLGYASTAHSAQGVTVDTSHAVVTPGMAAESLYVAMSRGREANTAHVTTQAERHDLPTGETQDRERMPVAQVVTDILAATDDADEAALVQQAADVRRSRSMHTVHAQYEDASRRICRLRTDRWLDELAADGTIDEQTRIRLAADQGTDQLSRLLRAAEQGGLDPVAVLREAAGEHELDTARSVAQVLQSRITTAHATDMRPHVDVLGDVPPADVPEPWRAHLAELAEVADDRRRELGTEVAQDAPEWAVTALGPVPDEPIARADWEHRAGIVASYREAAPNAAGDDGQVIGPAPGSSTPERRAMWHAAWTALGRPEAGAEEADLPEGALRIRVRAWEREQDWAPRNVDREMKATGQTVARYEQEAATLRAEADAAVDSADQERLRAEAADRAALAATMREVETGLAQVADERAAWYVETAATRDVARRAEAELAKRCRDIGAEDDRVTASEWLELHEQAMREDDVHRPVTEHDVDHLEDSGIAAAGDVRGEVQSAEEEIGDERGMPVGVPSRAETATAVQVARRAGDELADRRSAELARAHQEATDRAGAEQVVRERSWRDRDAEAVAAASRQSDVDASA